MFSNTLDFSCVNIMIVEFKFQQKSGICHLFILVLKLQKVFGLNCTQRELSNNLLRLFLTTSRNP